MEKYILIGTIGNPKGYAGEFILHGVPSSISILPKNIKAKVGFSENFAKDFILEKFFINQSKKYEARLAGVNSKEDVVNFKNQGLFVLLDTILKSNPDFYLADDIIGCDVIVESDGSLLGKVVEIWEMPANDVWLVQTKSGDLPIPVIDDIILSCDFPNKVIKIFLMDGLLDLLNKTGEADDSD